MLVDMVAPNEDYLALGGSLVFIEDDLRTPKVYLSGVDIDASKAELPFKLVYESFLNYSLIYKITRYCKCLFVQPFTSIGYSCLLQLFETWKKSTRCVFY